MAVAQRGQPDTGRLPAAPAMPGPARRGGAARARALTVSLVASTGDCFLVANEAKNPTDVDWSRVARGAFRAAGHIRVDGLLVLAHEGGRRFGARYLSPRGDVAVPTVNALRCGARLVSDQYGYRDLMLRCGSWRVPATVERLAVGLHLGTLAGLTEVPAAGAALVDPSPAFGCGLVLVRRDGSGTVDVLEWVAEGRPELGLPGAMVHVTRETHPHRLRAWVTERGRRTATLGGGAGAVAAVMACRQLRLLPAGPIEVHGEGPPLIVDTAASGPPFEDVRLYGPAITLLSGQMVVDLD
jgi:diaminopimelate epimerase